MACEAGSYPYLDGMRAEQTTVTTGEWCEVEVSWNYGPDEFDVVEINWTPAVQLDDPPAYEPLRLPTNNGQNQVAKIPVRQGLDVVVFVWPRMLDEQGFLEQSMEDSGGVMRPWFQFCASHDFHTTRAPSTDSAGTCEFPPRITHHDLAPGTITVHWDNPERYNTFYAEVDASSLPSGRASTGETEARSWPITRTRSGATYQFRVRGLHMGFAARECTSTYGPDYTVTVPADMGYVPPVFGSQASLATIVRAESFIDLFGTDPQGRVMSNWHEKNRWGMWFQLGDRAFGANAQLAALSRDPDFMDVFVIGDDGRAHVAWWNGNPWRTWVPVVDDARFPAGSAIAANSRTSDHMDLFAVDGQGHVVHSWWNGPPWRPWNRISGPDFPAGGHLAVVNRHGDHMELWGVGQDGVLHGTYWDGSWHDWYPFPGRSFPPGAPVAAVTRNPGHMEVFLVGDNGALCHRWWTEGDWSPTWGTLGGPIFRPKTPVTAQILHGDDMHVFAVNTNGVIQGIHFDEAWEDWYAVPIAGRQGMAHFLPPIASAVPRSPVVTVFTIAAAIEPAVHWSTFNIGRPAYPRPLI